MAVPSSPTSSSIRSLASEGDSGSLFDPPTRQSTGLTSIPARDELTGDATRNASLSSQGDDLPIVVKIPATSLNLLESGLQEKSNNVVIDTPLLVANRRLLLVDDSEFAEHGTPATGIISSIKKAFGHQEKYSEHRRVFFPPLSKTQTKGQSQYGLHRYRYNRKYSFTVLQSMHADKEGIFSTYLALQAPRGQRDTRLRVTLRIYEAVVPQPPEDPKSVVDSTSLSAARRERRVYARLGSLKQASKLYLLDAFGCLKSGGHFVFVTPAQHCTLHDVLFGKVKLDLEYDPIVLPRAWVAQLAIGLDVLHQEGIIHRNLSPKNILITHEGQLKIGEYYNAFVADRWAPLVPGRKYAFRPLGSSPYRAPEMDWRRERHGQIDTSRIMDADETNPHGLHHGYGKEADVWSLGCVAGEILRNAHEGHKVLFGKDDRFRKYATGNRRVQFGILERYIQTDNHFRVDIIYQLLHTDPQRRLILNKIPRHPFFAFWLMEKPRFPKGKRIKDFLALANYKPFSVEKIPLIKGFNLEHGPLGRNQAYITAWAEKPNGYTPTLESLDNYTWVNPEQPMN